MSWMSVIYHGFSNFTDDEGNVFYYLKEENHYVV